MDLLKHLWNEFVSAVSNLRCCINDKLASCCSTVVTVESRRNYRYEIDFSLGIKNTCEICKKPCTKYITPNEVDDNKFIFVCYICGIIYLESYPLDHKNRNLRQ